MCTRVFYNLTPDDTDAGNVCLQIFDIESALSDYLLHAMHMPLLILILITICGKENEDAKWFVCHTACFNLILGILWEIYSLILNVNPGVEDTVTILAMDAATELFLTIAVNSIFPLAFTKVFFLYFSNIYQRYFNLKIILLIFFVYDLALSSTTAVYLILKETTDSYELLDVNPLLGWTIVSLVINAGVLVGTIVCAALVFAKLRKMMHLIDGKANNFHSHSDLRRAAFICTFQAFLASFYLIANFYTTLYVEILYDPTSPNFYFFMDLFYILYELRYPMYQIFVIVDTCVTLFVLRSYRNVLIKIWLAIFNLFKFLVVGKKTNRSFVNSITVVKSVHVNNQ